MPYPGKRVYISFINLLGLLYSFYLSFIGSDPNVVMLHAGSQRKQLKNNMAAESDLIFVKVLRFYRLHKCN